MDTPSQEEVLSQLKSCPFCGAGETSVREKTHWTGMRSALLSVSIMHWCARAEGELQSVLEIKGRTHDEAISKWNGSR